MTRPLTLTPDVLRRIDAVVEAAGRNECLGLLASPRGAIDVTDFAVLPARATWSSAEAAPIAMKTAADALRARHLVPRGIWHSHGHMEVFHSGTDHRTIDRLLPAMAVWNFERDSAAARVPAVMGPSTAVLPLADGRQRRFALAPAPVAGGDLAELPAWERVSVEFGPDAEPAADIGDTHLTLSSGGVRVRLALPDGATVETQVVDPGGARIARLYSLVVNTRRERYAQCLVVIDVDGASVTRLGDCEVVEMLDAPAHGTRRDAEEHDFSLAALTGMFL